MFSFVEPGGCIEGRTQLFTAWRVNQWRPYRAVALLYIGVFTPIFPSLIFLGSVSLMGVRAKPPLCSGQCHTTPQKNVEHKLGHTLSPNIQFHLKCASQETEKIATAGSDSHPGEAKSVILNTFLKVSAEPGRGSRRLLAEDQGGTFRSRMPREGG